MMPREKARFATPILGPIFAARDFPTQSISNPFQLTAVWR